MVIVEEASELLFGRYRALAIYAAIARLPKPEFTTGQIGALTGIPNPVVSKELARLVTLGVIDGVSRRGDYERRDAGPFWEGVSRLADWFEDG